MGVKVRQNKKEAEVRYLFELRSVLYDQEWLKKAKNFPIYEIYRGLKFFDGIRYDETVIFPGIFGKEFAKTKGHFHLGNFGELYKVISGIGIFLLQKGKRKVKDVYFVRAKRGEFVLIPPGYGHVTINPSKKVLKIGNWISKDCLSDYLSVEKKKGLCYYLTIEGWIKNKNYKRVPKLKEKKPLKKMPKNLICLLSPKNG
mgnify:CR=1 FL=1